LKLFKNRFLDQIARSMIEDFKAGRAKELKKGSKTQLVSPATVNRELGTLKKILNMAVDDELITINPARKVKPFPEEFQTSTSCRSKRSSTIWHVPPSPSRASPHHARAGECGRG